MNTKAKTCIAVVLLLVGVLLTSAGVRLIVVRNTPVDFSYTYNNSLSDAPLYVTNIKIPSIKADLPVTEADITDGKWDNPENRVAHWKLTPLPGDKGNSVMYGHNWPVVLEGLKNVNYDDLVLITMSDGTTREFKIVNTYTVTKDQTHILNPTEDARLTIYTCTGFLDSKRFVVIATPIN